MALDIESLVSGCVGGEKSFANRAAIAENKFHYTRDATLREDASRIRKNPGVFARIRSFAYNILRFNQSDTIPQDRYAAALGGLKSIFSMTFSK